MKTSTWVRHRPIQGESNIDFLGESEGSLPPPQDSLPDAGEAMNDSWSMSGNFICRRHVGPKVKFYSPRAESFLIPLKYIDVTRTTYTNVDVKQEKGSMIIWISLTQETCLIHGQVSLNLFYSNKNLQTDTCNRRNGHMRSEGELMTSRQDNLWPELSVKMRKNVKLKEKQKWSHEKFLLGNARKLRRMYVIDFEDKNLKRWSRMFAKNCLRNSYNYWESWKCYI